LFARLFEMTALLFRAGKAFQSAAGATRIADALKYRERLRKLLAGLFRLAQAIESLAVVVEGYRFPAKIARRVQSFDRLPVIFDRLLALSFCCVRNADL